MELAELRDRINEVDAALLPLFLKRMELSEEIAGVKKEQGLPVYNAKREREILSWASREAGGKEAQSGEDWPDSGEDPDSFGDEDSDEDGVYDSDGEISDEQLDAWLSQMQDDEEGEDDSDGGLPDGGNDGHQD